MTPKRWRSRLLNPNRLERCGGFTLIELIVAMSVAAILIVAAIPSYNNYVANAFVTGAINNLSNSIATARAEAIRYGIRAVIKPKTGTDWLSGWMVFVDKNSNGSYEQSDDELLLNIESSDLIGLNADNARTTGLATIGYIAFDSAGITQAPVGSVISPRAVISFINPVNQREQSVIVERSGKIWDCNPNDRDPQKSANCK